MCHGAHNIRNLCIIELDYFHPLLIPLANLDSVTRMIIDITFESDSMYLKPCSIDIVQTVSDLNGHLANMSNWAA